MKKSIDLIEQAVHDGIISEDRINASAYKILKMKEKVGAKNDLESYTYQLKSAVEDDKNALEEDDRTQLKEKVDERSVQNKEKLRSKLES